MPAMKRPAAAVVKASKAARTATIAKAAKAAKPAKVASEPQPAEKAPALPPPPPSKCAQVVEAIQACDELPESVRFMLVEVLPGCLVQDRHSIHNQMLSMVEEALTSNAASMAGRAEAAAAAAAQATEKHEEDQLSVEGAQRAVGEARESVAQKQARHASATDAYQKAQSAEAQAKEAVAASAQKCDQVSQEKTALLEEVQSKLLALNAAVAPDEAEVASLVDRCKSYDFDAGVLASLSCVLNKAPESRSRFDQMVATQFDEDVHKKVAGFDCTLKQGESEVLRLEGEHKVASEATATALAAQEACSADLESEQERLKNAMSAITDAGAAALKSGSAAQAAGEMASALKQQCDDYHAGPIAAFRAAVDGEKEAVEKNPVSQEATKQTVEATEEVVAKEPAEGTMDVAEATEEVVGKEPAEASMDVVEAIETVAA